MTSKDALDCRRPGQFLPVKRNGEDKLDTVDKPAVSEKKTDKADDKKAVEKESDDKADAETEKTLDETAVEKKAESKTSHGDTKKSKPMKPYDWFVLVLGIAIIAISLLSILAPLGIFGA